MPQIERLLEQLVEQNEQILQRLDKLVDSAQVTEHSVDWTNPGSSSMQVLESLAALRASVEALELRMSR